jgi:hypothetical protein
VLILGPIHMEDLGKLKGLGGLGSLGDIAQLRCGRQRQGQKKGQSQEGAGTNETALDDSIAFVALLIPVAVLAGSGEGGL